MKRRTQLSDPNAERIIRIFEYGAILQLFSSNWTPLRYEDFMKDDGIKRRTYNKKKNK
jgi:hypothetical protein